MDVTKRNRIELKSYFVNNAIPTEAHFAELIDGAVNQREDGIVKAPGSPLSIEAVGDEASQKKALDLYASFADERPAWTLSLNPRKSPADPESARRGLSIGDGDGDGQSRLFLDSATGNVGAGTVEPAARLHVAGDMRVDGNLDAGTLQSRETPVQLLGDVEITGSVRTSRGIRPKLSRWTQVPGDARDIAVGAHGTVWTVSNRATGGDYYIRRLRGSSWFEFSAFYGVRIATEPSGKAWKVNVGDSIYTFNGTGFSATGGKAQDIGVDAVGTAWIVGTTAVAGGFGILRSKGAGLWVEVPGIGGQRIAVSTGGTPWVVDANNKIFRREGEEWVELPGAARDIGVGRDDNAWIIGTTPAPGGYSIHRWTGSDWSQVEGGGTDICVSPEGVPWIVDDQQRIFKRTVKPTAAAY